MTASTRQETPRIVDPTAEAIAMALNELRSELSVARLSASADLAESALFSESNEERLRKLSKLDLVLRRLGLGMQADRARAIALAAKTLRDREYQAAHDKAVREDMQSGDYWGGLNGNRTGD